MSLEIALIDDDSVKVLGPSSHFPRVVWRVCVTNNVTSRANVVFPRVGSKDTTEPIEMRLHIQLSKFRVFVGVSNFFQGKRSKEKA